MSTNPCALYCTFAYKFSAHQSVSAMPTRSTVRSSVIAVLRYNLKYSMEHISATVRVTSTTRCPLNSTVVAKYSAHQPVCGMSTGSPVKSSVFAVWRFRLEYAIELIFPTIGFVSTIRCALNSAFLAKYSSHRPDCRMPTRSPVRSSVIEVFRASLKYSIERISPTTRVMSAIPCSLNAILDAK